MATPRNLFRLRTAEQAHTDDQFLALFGAKVLDLVRGEEIWDRLVRIESAPGGGKTSLLRLFTPGSLTRVLRVRRSQESQELARHLDDLGVIRDGRVRLLGVLINCHHDYSQIADRAFSDSDATAQFMSLLDARIALMTLRAICQLARLSFPDDVARISFEPQQDVPDASASTVTGDSLFETSRDTEIQVSRTLNSLLPTTEPVARIGRLETPRLLTTHAIFVDGESLVDRVVLMFDDAHSLAPAQQAALESELLRHDLSVGRWIARRLSALTAQEALSEPITDGREVVTIRLDDWNRPAFERWLLDIADRRALRVEPSLQSFHSLLDDSPSTDPEWVQATTALTRIRESVEALASPHGDMFHAWLARTAEVAASLPPPEAASAWSELRILINRRLYRRQGEFDMGPLSEQLAGSDAAVREAARLFAATEYDLPYYFGAQRIAQLGSWNVDQFLSVAADVFDTLINGGLLGPAGPRRLSAAQQDRIVRSASRSLFSRLRADLPYGEDVTNLIRAVGAMARSETHRETAPYAPGVTGFALSMSDRAALLRAEHTDAPSGRLLKTLTSAIAHNVLSPRLDQRVKGETWMVLYLNRLLCPTFDLPLGYGGFREQSLSEVTKWVATGTPTTLQQMRLR